MWQTLTKAIAMSLSKENQYRQALETIASGRNEQGLYATKQILQAVAKRALV